MLQAADERDIAAGRNTIPFPYEPYPQQRDLMLSIYDSISQKRSGCFESPTGTGKSLSVLCAALHWQRLHENAILRACTKQSEIEDAKSATSSGKSTSNNVDWLSDILSATGADVAATAKKENKARQKALRRLGKVKSRLEKAASIDPSNRQAVEALYGNSSGKLRRLSNLFAGAGPPPSTSTPNNGNTKISTIQTQSAGEEIEFVLDVYESDEGERTEKQKHSKGRAQVTDVDKLLNDPFGLEDGRDSDSDSGSGDEAGKSPNDTLLDDRKYLFRKELNLPQIFYCSRTHSQIAQFVSEMRKTAYGHDLRCVTLGSRKNMCINTEVNRLGSDSRINDRCLEMQKSGTNVSIAKVMQISNSADDTVNKRQRTAKLATCKFKNKRLEQIHAEFSASKVRDIEELVGLGRTLDVCPYYSTRRAVQMAQIVCAPYSILLHADTRESMGVDLRDAVVIFDEAHNVVEAVNAIHSADVTATQLDAAYKAVSTYLERFQLALSGKNLFYVTLLSTVIRKLSNALKSYDRKAATASATVAATSTAISLETGSAQTKNLPGKEFGTENTTSSPAAGLELQSCNDFLFSAKLDNVNLFKLKRHIMATNLIAKIGGYSENIARKAAAAAMAEQTLHSTAMSAAGLSNVQSQRAGCETCTGANSKDDGENEPENNFNAHTHALRAVLGLFTCLTNSDADGRIVMSRVVTPVHVAGARDSRTSPAAANEIISLHIRFVLLNAAVHFRRLVDDARSVLLLGGTLQPFGYVTASLFEGCTKPIKDLTLFSCGHVVDRRNVMALTVGRGPNGVKLEFTHKSRSAHSILDELYFTLLQAVRTCPHGMVVFFTSYVYMSQVLAMWSTRGYLAKLQSFKRLFTEPRTVAESDRVWEEYSAAVTASVATSGSRITGSGGAMLFCVMGGKLSEGINFSDELARCVVVVGMPYPDGRDPILQEKMRRADLQESKGLGSSKTSMATNGAASGNGGGAAGRRLYEAMCMKSVNQSIGRSIRHAKDYAAILLLDCRYEQDNVIQQLPGWIARSVERPSSFEEVLASLQGFYVHKSHSKT